MADHTYPLGAAQLAALAMDLVNDMSPAIRAQVAEVYKEGKPRLMDSSDVAADLARLSMKLRLSNAITAVDTGEPVKNVVKSLESNPFRLPDKVQKRAALDTMTEVEVYRHVQANAAQLTYDDNPYAPDTMMWCTWNSALDNAKSRN